VRIEIVGVADMDEAHRVCQLGEFGEREIRDSGSYGAGGEAEHWLGDSCLVEEMRVDIAAGVVRGSGGFGSAERDTGWYWTRTVCAGTVTGHCTSVLESAGHSDSAGVLGWAEGEEVDLDR
jgi:hypothetical protein